MGDDALEAQNMNLLRAVGQASRFESQVVTLSHNGGAENEPPIVLVGKVRGFMAVSSATRAWRLLLTRSLVDLFQGNHL